MFIAILSNYEIIYGKQCKFENIPNIPINVLQYKLPNNKTVRLSGFDKYIIVQEIYSIVQGGSGTMTDTIHVVGYYNDEIYQFSYNVRNCKAFQRKGKDFYLLSYNTKINKYEYSRPQKINPSLWKLGSSALSPTARII